MSSSKMPEGPSEDERGKYMSVDGAEFRTRDQLSKVNRERLSKKGLKPIELVTFSDVRACNRDHLRTYCGVYDMKRKEKDEMELDMARYVAAWHHGEPGYDISTYVPSKPPAAASTPPPGAAHSTRSSGSRRDSASSDAPAPLRSSRRSSAGGGGGGSDASAASPAAGSKRAASATPPKADPKLLQTAAARPETRTAKRARITSPAPQSASPGKRSSTPTLVKRTPSPAVGRKEASGSAAKKDPKETEPSDEESPAKTPTAPATAKAQSEASDGEADGEAAADAPMEVSEASSPGAVDEPPAEEAAAEKTPTPDKPRMVAVPDPRPPPAAAASPSQAGSASRGSPGGSSASAGSPIAAGASASNTSRLQNTCFKQYAHAQHATARYKAAYNGGGAAIVQVVENAAAYFEGRDTTDIQLNKESSLDRYRFNIDMLSEIFDGPPLPRSEVRKSSDHQPAANSAVDGDGDTVMKGDTPAKQGVPQAAGTAGASARTGEGGSSHCVDDERRKQLAESMLQRLADGMRSRSPGDRELEVAKVESEYQSLVKNEKDVEKVMLRSLHKLEKARTPAEVHRVRREFEAEHGVRFVEGGKPIAQRTISKNVPAFVPPAKLRVVKLG